MYIVHPPPLMNKRFYTRTLLSKWAANSISTWNNFQLFIQSERVCLWILTWSLYKSINCLQILCGKRWKSVETARLDVLEAGSRWCCLFSFSFFAKGGKGLKQVGRMYLRPIVDDSICTALPTWPQTNEPASGRCGGKPVRLRNWERDQFAKLDSTGYFGMLERIALGCAARILRSKVSLLCVCLQNKIGVWLRLWNIGRHEALSGPIWLLAGQRHCREKVQPLEDSPKPFGRLKLLKLRNWYSSFCFGWLKWPQQYPQ